MRKKLFALLTCVVMLATSLALAAPASAAITVEDVTIRASWNKNCTKIENATSLTDGCAVTKVEFIRSGISFDAVIPGDRVTVAFTVKLDDGYSFSSSPMATWNGTYSDVTEANGDGTVRFGFEMTSPSPIDIAFVEIEGVTEPVGGDAPDNSFTVVSPGVQPAKTGAWFNVDENRWMNEGERFETGKTYDFYSYFETVDIFGYVWPDDVNTAVPAFVNGKKAKIASVGGETYKSVSCSFVCADPSVPLPVYSVMVFDVQPAEIGRAATETLEVPEDCHYYVYDYYWFETDTRHQLAKDEKFVADRNYQLCVMFKTEPRYTISNIRTTDVDVLDVFGNTMALDEDRGHNVNEGYYYVLTKPMLSTSGTIITSINVTGMKRAQIGETAAETLEVPAGSHYYVSCYRWHVNNRGHNLVLEDDDVFDSYRFYHVLCIEIKAEDGYTLNYPNMTLSVKDVSGYPIATQKGSGYDPWTDSYVIYTNGAFPEPGKISNAVITVTHPVAGETPNVHFTLAHGDSQIDQVGEWYNVTDDKPQNDAPFEADKLYEFRASVTSPEGYSWLTFPEMLSVTINGKPGFVDDATSRRFLSARSDAFLPYSDKVITFVEISGVTEPVAGQKPNRDFKIDTQGVRAAQGGAWYNVTDDKWLDDNDAFEEGKIYKFAADIDLKDGFLRPDSVDEVSCAVNGKPAAFTYIDGQPYACVYSDEFTCVAAPAEPGEPGEPAEPGDDESASLWWLWALIGVILVGGGSAAFFIVKKKGKDNK